MQKSGPVVLDRPKGNVHPRYPDLIYPLDYGYLENTSAADGGGIDVWIGTNGGKKLTGILCTFDKLKRDAEIKLLIGCTLERYRNDSGIYKRYGDIIYSQPHGRT